MPDIKISDLTAATAASGAMQLEVNDSLSSKKVTVDQLKAYVLPAASITTTQLAASAVNLATQVSGVLPVTNGGSGVSTSTGSGNNVLSNSPTLVTPALGTPASGNLTNCTFPTLNQNTTGTAANVTGVVGVANGGTGLSSAGSSGQVPVSNGTDFVMTTLSTVGTLIGHQLFKVGGTYTKATNNPSFIIVELVGGGGGAGTSAGTGGTTSFGAWLSATGGGAGSSTTGTPSGAPGVGSTGDLNLQGTAGSCAFVTGGSVSSAIGGYTFNPTVKGGTGGGSRFSGGSASLVAGGVNTGGGAGGTASSGGGSSGGYSMRKITAASLAASETVTIGAGGTGTHTGGTGLCIVWEYK